MAADVPFKLLNYLFVFLWRPSLMLLLVRPTLLASFTLHRPCTVRCFSHGQKRILHALLDQVSWRDWDLLNFFELLRTASLVPHLLTLHLVFRLEFLFQILYLKVHYNLNWGPYIFEDGKPCCRFQSSLLFFKDLLCDVVQFFCGPDFDCQIKFDYCVL